MPLTVKIFLAGILVAIIASSIISASIITLSDNSTTIQGPKGEKGDNGPSGPQGPKGQTGADGSTGSAGSTGAAGQQGPQGPAGASGGLTSPDFDSGWIDIGAYKGKYFNITDSLNSVDVQWTSPAKQHKERSTSD